MDVLGILSTSGSAMIVGRLSTAVEERALVCLRLLMKERMG